MQDACRNSNDLSMAHKVEHSSIVTQLREQNQRLVSQIKQFKNGGQKVGFTAIKIPTEKNEDEDRVPGMLLEQPGSRKTDDEEEEEDEEDDTYYICDDYVQETMKKESISQSEIIADTINPKFPELVENTSSTTLCEQLTIMEKMRNLLQSPLQQSSVSKFDRIKCSISPRDSITLLNQSKTSPKKNNEIARSSTSSDSSVSSVSSASSASSESSLLSAHTMICHKNANTQSPSSTTVMLLPHHGNQPLASLNSNTSYYTTPTPSSCRLSVHSNSMQSTPSSVSLASSVNSRSRSHSQEVEERFQNQKHTFLAQSLTTETEHADHFVAVDVVAGGGGGSDLEQQKQEIHKFMDDSVLKEENESDFDDDAIETDEDAEEDDVSEEEEYSTDDETYYFNNFSLNDGGGNVQAVNGMFRQRTDSQIFRESGLELSRKLKAKSVESPCHNNQRLSSTFALHWINIKK